MNRKLTKRTKREPAEEARYLELVEQVTEPAPRQYARWSGETFADFCSSGARDYWQQLGSFTQPDREAILLAYLQLLREAIGTALIPAGTRSGGSFLGYCLGYLVPQELPRRSPREQLQQLVSLWNLGEGLAGESSWVGQYVTSRLEELESLSGVKEFLISVLDPVLTPGNASSWSGPYLQTVLDLRQVDEDFLPGEMTLIAPHVLCIQDRLRPTRLGILLQKNRSSRILGTLAVVNSYNENWKSPKLKWEANAARVNDQAIPFPYLNGCHASLITRSGFLVATAVDTQRLWIAESASPV